MPDKQNPYDKSGATKHQQVQQNPTAWIKNNPNDAVFLNAHGNAKFEQIYNDRLQKAFGGDQKPEQK
jgi:hypothetical protein